MNTHMTLCKIIKRIGNVIPSIKLLLCALYTWLTPKTDCWLITERFDQARDNGYCFFRYLREAHPAQQVYYVIDPSAADIAKVNVLGEVVAFDSWRHYYLYCASKVHISAHVNGCCPTGAIAASRRLKRFIGFKDVFLPHGVSYGIAEFCLKKYTDIDLFITSGKPEYENVLANYGYSRDEVAYTGFPRLDGWHNKTVDDKLLLLMPTWRLYLAQKPDTVFEATDYFAAYQAVLNDAALSDYLLRNGYRLVFYLHHDMRKFVHSFKSNCPNIEIVDRDDTYDIQQLLKSAALLITDYSSVHFDFAYMNKPVIYYQFDRERFFTDQYASSGFDAVTDGFGPVAATTADLTGYICASCSVGNVMQPVYNERMRSFYQLYDAQNCYRIYHAIIERILK